MDDLREEFTGLADSETLKSGLRFIIWSGLSCACVIMAMYIAAMIDTPERVELVVTPPEVEQAEFLEFSAKR